MKRNIFFVGLIGFAVVLLLLVPNAQSDEGVLDVFGVGEYYSSGQSELTSHQPQQANVAVMPLDQEPWGVYENWSKPTIRSDRWLIRTGIAHEARREVKGNSLLMRFRLEGATTRNDGFNVAMQAFRMLNPRAVNAIKVKFLVKNYTVVGCEENKEYNLMTRIRPAGISMSKFNDGSSQGSTDQTGDHFIMVMANREAFTSDPQGVMTVQAFLSRCKDSACSSSVSTVYNLNMGQVKVGEEFSLRIVWDAPNHCFLVGYNNNPDVVLEYDPALNKGPVIGAGADFHTILVNANCEEGPTINDTEIKVLKVYTNASAIIP